MSAAVIQLPTAAPSKVRQCRSRTTRADRKALLYFPVLRRTPLEREAEKSAAIVINLEMTPAMAMATAMFQTMDQMAQWRTQAFLSQLVDCPHKEAVVQALEYTLYITATPAKRRAIIAAMERLNGEA